MYAPPHDASLTPKRPRQDQRDSCVSASVWGGKGRSIIPKLPTGRPYPPNGPDRTRGDSGVSAAVWGGAEA